MVASPFKLLLPLIKQEQHDLSVLVIYTVFAGILSLAIPLGAQVLINTLAGGVLSQSLIVISFLVLIGLVIFGVFQLAQIVIVEKLQQRIFTKISIKLSLHIPKIKLQELKKNHSPGIVNRFFEIMILQKAFAKILIHWPSAILQIIIGLVLVWIYNVYLLAFSIFILIFIFAIYFLGYGGVDTSISESSAKYYVADWLEDLARCHFTFKISSAWAFVNNKTDELILDYLNARKKHFKIILRQYTTYYFFYAFASAGILSLGGLLVINNQLSLGQLVASELIIINLLKATEKIMNFIDNYYDLIAGIDKITAVLDLKTEKNYGEKLSKNYIDLKCKNLSLAYGNNTIIDNIDIHVKPGQKVSLIGRGGAGKTSLAYLLSGALDPNRGHVYINDIDIKNYNLTDLRSKISIISNTNEIFKGSIKDNIIISNPECPLEHLNKVIRLVGLENDMSNFVDGLETKLVNEGLNISLGQRLRILIARAIIKDPYLLILDEALLNIDVNEKDFILKTIYDKNNKWTVIDISNDYDTVKKSDYIYAIDNKKIVEHGTPVDLFNKENSFINNFFVKKGLSND